MAIPNQAFKVWNDGASASLHLTNLPMPDTFEFANNVSVSGEVSVSVKWKATEDPVRRGRGTKVPATDPAAFKGQFAAATCNGTVSGTETGFWFESGKLNASKFFAEMGPERNGAFLT